MQYHLFRKGDIAISRLGFGSMRLPTMEFCGDTIVDEEHAIPVTTDTARWYQRMGGKYGLDRNSSQFVRIFSGRVLQ